MVSSCEWHSPFLGKKNSIRTKTLIYWSQESQREPRCPSGHLADTYLSIWRVLRGPNDDWPLALCVTLNRLTQLAIHKQTMSSTLMLWGRTCSYMQMRIIDGITWLPKMLMICWFFAKLTQGVKELVSLFEGVNTPHIWLILSSRWIPRLDKLFSWNFWAKRKHRGKGSSVPLTTLF